MGWTIIKLFLGGLWDAFLSKFGVSPQERLGQQETIVGTQQNEIKDIEDARAIQDAVNRMSDAAVASELRKRTRSQ